MGDEIIEPAKHDEEQEQEEDEEKSPLLVEEAVKAAERIEAANKKMETLIRRQEALQVERTLGGRADTTPNEAPKEDTPEEYAQKALKGEL